MSGAAGAPEGAAAGDRASADPSATTPASAGVTGASAGTAAPSSDGLAPLPVAAGPQPDDLVVSPEAACGLVSEHGGEIVIMDDGRVVFMNASAHLVELAAALDPENADVQKRLAAIERAKAAAGGPTEGAPAGGAGGGGATTPHADCAGAEGARPANGTPPGDGGAGATRTWTEGRPS